MATWGYAIGSLVGRSALAPVAVSPATFDALLPATNLGNGYPDELAGFTWRSDGAYAVDFDLNLLANASERADAPTGWADYLNFLAGTPGLPANPPDWGNYGARNPALRFFRPSVQEIDVMPGETVKLDVGIYWVSAGSTATGVRVRVVDRWSGKGWNGSAWASGGVLDSTTVADTWKDIAEQIDADTARTERTTYLVILEPIATSFGVTTVCYASDNGAAGSPALYGAVDLCAIVGHNLPANATVTLAPQPSGTSITLTPAQPSMYTVAVASQLIQVWRLSIQMPTGNQPRPILGEVWIGTARTFDRSPTLPIPVTEADKGQVRIEAARGRVEVLSDPGRPAAGLRLEMSTPEADYVRVRDEIMRLTRFGGEPMLLIPSAAFEGGRFYHGRVGQEISYTRFTAADGTEHWRSFQLAFDESPFAAS